MPAGKVGAAPAPAGYYFSHQINDSFIVINRLLKAGEEVSWLDTGPLGRGTFHVVAKPTTKAILDKAAAELGVSFEAAPAAPSGVASKLRAPRIGLFDTYGGSMPSGWTRLILENFEFPYERVYPPDLDKGSLREKFDVIVFNGTGLQARRWRARWRPRRQRARRGGGGTHQEPRRKAARVEADARASPRSRFRKRSPAGRGRSPLSRSST